MITPEYLVTATGCTYPRAALYAPLLNSTADRWDIDTPLRRAAWIAQVAHESVLFSRVEESLVYKTPARLIEVWPSRFRLPVTEREEKLDRFHDGKRNPKMYVRQPQRLANFVYANRMGNGDEESGDAAAYIGRGLMMLTGRSNYASYQLASKYPVLANPEMVSWPLMATDSAGWFWSMKGCNAWADAMDWAGLTKKINGGMIGYTARKNMTVAALKASGVMV